jgi:hypothetical protein
MMPGDYAEQMDKAGKPPPEPPKPMPENAIKHSPFIGKPPWIDESAPKQGKL